MSKKSQPKKSVAKAKATNGQKKVTIVDIAKVCQVSPTTVSLIMNNKADHISAETKLKVMEATKNYNYRPNLLASSLVTKKTHTIALIVPDIRNPFFGEVANGITEHLRKHNYTLLLCISGDKSDNDLPLIDTLASQMVDGVLYCMSGDMTRQDFASVYQKLISQHFPSLLLDRFYAEDFPNIQIVTLKHRQGGFLEMDHLLSQGHKNIACILGPSHLMDANQRYLGYLQAFGGNATAHALTTRLDLPSVAQAKTVWQTDDRLLFVYEGNYHASSGVEATQDILAYNAKAPKEQQITAICASNDLMAFGALNCCQNQGVLVPSDISVIGYDDISLIPELSHELTSLHQSPCALGVHACDVLLNLISADHKVTTSIPEPYIAERLTVCPPKHIS